MLVLLGMGCQLAGGEGEILEGVPTVVETAVVSTATAPTPLSSPTAEVIPPSPTAVPTATPGPPSPTPIPTATDTPIPWMESTVIGMSVQGRPLAMVPPLLRLPLRVGTGR